jgi:AcrR family transcriptional regulator
VSRTGRRPGLSGTREDILVAARRGFGARGYEATTFRSIAEDVGVDPGLLVHYFGTKEGLFVAALSITLRPPELFGDLGKVSASDAAELIVRRYLAMLDQDETRDMVLGLVRSAVSNERAAGMLGEFVAQVMRSSLSELINRSDAELRAALVVAHLLGIAMLRHVVKEGTIVHATDDELVSLVAPVIASYLQ